KPMTTSFAVARRSVTTDAEGRFELKDVPPGLHFIQSPNNYPGLSGANSMVPFQVIAGEVEKEIHWDFPLCEVRGRVMACKSGGAPENVRAEILKKPGFSGSERTPAATRIEEVPLDESGRFSYKHLSSGEYLLLVRGRGWEMASREFEIGDGEPSML